MDDPRRPTELGAVQTALWQELTRAPHDKHHEWRTPVLATVDEDGQAADARTVVLREVDAAASTLVLFSDARAAKLAQLQAHPVGTLVFWSKRLGWQLRLRVRLQAQTEGLAVSSRWARLKLSPAAQDYLSPLAPGAALDAPAAPSRAPGAVERGHFALLLAQVQSTDWLELHRDGHRRARFDATGARWLVP
ncbi:pyridoxamine 5'-phosphate oxidase family protein [Rubrivivax rivuli]|uniref:Pyridoxamine 5'-phosphate oxidase n=1 Tax=Rubrivivax rivuli TaxID=1862385 RepID=A0A437R9G2_9BURK|nr:pyridoxamine 5'-phosphate oxidase family protein [Rubrivivax rivuli]RVU43421.1 pyridoxamine 5'-phosphate oxidase [Rubrivivax rivuli]